MSILKYGDQIVAVHVVEGDKVDGRDIPIPDIRAGKPIGMYDQKVKQTVFFQRLIELDFENSKISIAAPNEISLSLSISKKSQERASDLKKVIARHSIKSDGPLYDEDVKIAYDFLEEVQTAIIFSYKAVESFCNATIPDDYSYKKKNNKGIEEHYGKKEIERWINTSQKVSEILPLILGSETPAKEEFWSHFKNLERIRNDIVHSKTISSTSILSELFSSEIDSYINSCTDILLFFIKNDPSNQNFPLGFGMSQIKTIVAENADEILSRIK